ncbi:hypothetical protein BH11BAC6_BH11BAC6_16070 [soil metagenome]
MLNLQRQNYTVMRYLTIILMVIFLSACGNKLSTLEYTKVSKAVSTCTEAAKTICTELDNATEVSDNFFEEDEFNKTVNNWDTHMMLR